MRGEKGAKPGSISPIYLLFASLVLTFQRTRLDLASGQEGGAWGHLASMGYTIKRVRCHAKNNINC